jgi:hypothetical protein
VSLARSLAAIVVAVLLHSAAHSQVNVTTYHMDNARTGANTLETILGPANVNSSQFGKLFADSVDGAVYAQPLYLSNVAIAGGTHNVLYVATEHDSVYAIDADSGAVYAQRNLIPSGGSTVNSSTDLRCTDLIPEIGITGTPVIDASTGTLYLVAKSKVSGKIVQYLHALDVTSLAEKFGGPVQINASVSGNGYDASQGVITFNPTWENQRAALLLSQGHVIIGWSSHCDTDPWHGWVISYNAATLAQEAVFNTTPNGRAGGVWMSGGGIAADALGNVYFATGNGSWSGSSDFGDSIVKLGPPAQGQFPVLDYFTPYNQASLDSNDEDVGSGGLLLLPPPSSGDQLLVQQSKQGTIYLLDIDDLGRYCLNSSPPCSKSDPQIVQEIANATTGIWGSPAYWNGHLYWSATDQNLFAFSFNQPAAAPISAFPTSKSAQVFAFAAPTPTVSANGSTNGIVWVLDGAADDSTCGGTYNCLGLYAYDATNLSHLLYSSRQVLSRDNPGSAVKFQAPIIANGKVYVGLQGALAAYGLLAANQTAPPTFSPAAGTYSNAQSISLADATPGAAIYYTTDGSTPTTSSAKYSASNPIVIATTMTLQAIAVAAGQSSSTVSSATYTISTGSGATPVSVSLAAANNIDAISSIGNAPRSGGIDGRGNAYAGGALGTSVAWNGSSFAIGAAGGADAASNTTISLPPGNYAALNVLGTAVNGNQAGQVFTVTYTDGTTGRFTQSLSDWFTPQNYPGESIALQMPYRIDAAGTPDTRPFNLYGYSFALNPLKSVKSLSLPKNRDVVVLALDLLPATTQQTAAVTLTPPPGTYATLQSVTLADATPGAAIYYTTDGSLPSTSSQRYGNTPLTVSASTTIETIATAPGYSTSPVSGGTYTITALPPAATPTFSPPAGTYNSVQSVSLGDSTPGAVIHYTTDGSTPIPGSPVYATPLNISTTTRVQAIATASGYAPSAVASASYTIASSGSATSVSLTNFANVDAIATAGTPVKNGGIDGKGNAYAEALLGSSIAWNGLSFALIGAGGSNGASETIIPLPAGSYSTLSVLGTGVNGNQTDQTFVVSYTDGTSKTLTQSMSDWSSSQGYSGETVVLSMAYRITPSGAPDNRPFNLYGYVLELDASKTVKSLTLPKSRNAVILALVLAP